MLTAPRGKYCDFGEPQPETPLLIEVDYEENNNSNDGHDETSWEKQCRRCRRRKRRMVVGGVAGLVIGSILFCGPIGAVLGAVGGAWATLAISKRRGNLKDQRSGIKVEEQPVVPMADEGILK